MKKLFLILACLISTSVLAAETKECCKRPPPSNVAFTQLTTLAGSWVGTDPHDKKKTARVNYKITAGGSTLLETLFPGMPHEMVTTYVGAGKEIRATHYCMLGNQPNLISSSVKGTVYHFKYAKTPGINTHKDMYMGELTLTLMGKNHLKQEWVAFEKGKKKMTTVLELSRVKKS